MTWTPSDEALAFSRYAFENLGAPDYSGLTSPDLLKDDGPWGDVYAEAVSGMAAFMREARFHIALAGLYMADAAVRGADESENPDLLDSSGLRDVGLPPAVMAWIMTFSPALPEPEDVLLDPYQHAVGGSTAGKWWASSLLDSAILRLVFAVDRVAAVLWAHYSRTRALPAPAPETRWPRFKESLIQKWDGLYRPSDSTAWTELIDLSRSDMWAVLEEWRHGLVHRTRPVSELEFPTMIRDPIRAISANTTEDFHWGIAGGGYWWAIDVIQHGAVIIEAHAGTGTSYYS